ncbi:MAG TPA: hypothetical protein VFA69_07120 [Candidatus Nitrosotalea sp.]|nr:hypothetical protein [Candidatus Nitrosotalea sp.]
MQVGSQSHVQKYLVISLLAIVAMWTTGYFLGQRAAILSSDFAYIPLTILLTITAFFQIYQTRKENKNILPWYVFAVFALTYNIAQHIWSLNELIVDQKPFPSFADVAFIISTISLVIFFMLIIKSKKQSISRWMYVVAIPSGCFTIGLAMYFFISNNTELIFEQILSLVYPLLDSIALVPALIGIMMYFKNKINFATCLICLSMIPLTIGDILFQITTASNTYYSGSITDLFYYIQITLLIFGVYILSNDKIRSNASVS